MKFLVNLVIVLLVIPANINKFLILFLILLSVKIVVLFHLLMMEELNSETMILILSVLISNCNFCNSTVCEDSAINIYHSPSVICHILFGVNYSIIIDCEISNNDVCVKHFVYMISYL